jgi:ubiquinone/menaquinone biosynthesis C-methylase UbiE
LKTSLFWDSATNKKTDRHKMENFNRKKHWETIYQTKQFEDVSWFQPTPETSLSFFKELNIPTSAKIIDIGGGDSFLVDNLLGLNYQDLTVLDISATALDKAKQRLGERADKVKWIVADVATFRPTEKYDFWHDRAAFHFLTQELEVENYLNTVQRSIQPTGVFVIGTFSEQGPKKCSGIEIKQYSETTMTDRLAKFFEKIKCIKVDHKTPSDTIQNFIFCSFKKLRKKSVTHF